MEIFIRGGCANALKQSSFEVEGISLGFPILRVSVSVVVCETGRWGDREKLET
ncbi:hypothetical protein [Chamaesiphon minutus]|uniref:hypothetical protein n=1 Tax=Chamaesiphon minutus TaxID=1173032 RepID=UPI0012F8A4BB|nr:hypothetical protein [Chamaesiphon minutus]